MYLLLLAGYNVFYFHISEICIFINLFLYVVYFLSFFLDLGAHPNVVNGQGVTPLHEAVKRKNLDILKILLSSGADPTVKCSSGLVKSICFTLVGNLFLLSCSSSFYLTKAMTKQ